MSIHLDLSDDYLVIDNRETVTFKQDGQADILLDDCVITEPYSYREMDPTGGQVLRYGTTFVWPQKLTPRPAIGSIVLDEDSIYWTVWRLLKKQHVDCWEAFCLNLNIINATANHATLLKATYDKGDANEAVASWVGLNSGSASPTAQDTVTARFQPSEETAQIMFGGEFTKTTYKVYFDDAVPIEMAGGEYRIVDGDGFRYRVMRYINEQRLDKLPMAIAVRIQEGAEYFDGGPPNETYHGH
jgi:hypothetical protein